MSTPSQPKSTLAQMGGAGIAAVALLAFVVLYLPGETPKALVDLVQPAIPSGSVDPGAETGRSSVYYPAVAAAANAQNRGSASEPPSLANLHERVANSRRSPTDRARAIAAMDQTHAAEPVDSAWSAASELTISGASGSQVMREAGLQPLATASDCRSKTCRISATFVDEEQAQSWGMALVTQMGSTLSQARMAVRTLEDGSAEVVIFGTRRG